MTKLIETLQTSLGEALPGVAGALALLVIGWLVATVIKIVLKKTLNLMKLNERLESKGGKSGLDLEKGISMGGYYVVLLMVLLAVFNQLGLDVASQPIQSLLTQFLDFIPNFVSGGVLLLIAWLCGNVLKQIITGALSLTTLDDKVKLEKKSLSETLGEVSFWLVILVFLPGVLGIFNLEGLMEPAQSMVDKIVGMVPNIFGGTIIIFVGWLIAKILRDIVTNVLMMSGVDKLGEKVGLAETFKVSKITGLMIYVFTFVPAIIAGLNALKIDAIAKPATDMLTIFIAAVPDVLVAGAIIMVTYVVARPISAFVTNICASTGLDRFPEKIGIKKANSGGPLSALAGKVVFFFMVLFASVEAANRLGFNQLTEIVGVLINLGGQVLLGSIIIGVGLWIANIVSGTISKTSKGENLMAGLVKVIILGLVFAMGLRAMGIANDIVNMAFGLTLGSAAITFALSFGLGGREAAGKQMDHWLKNLRNEK